LSVPFGLYVAGGFNGTSTLYIGAMRMRSDGTYTQRASSGLDIPDPDTGQSGTYQVVSSSSIRFLTGPYAGSSANLVPDYKGTGRKYIDVSFQGVVTSYGFFKA